RTDEKSKEQRDERESRQHAGVLKSGHDSAPRCAPSRGTLPPDASSTHASSVHSDAGRAEPSRPRDMTAMRSHKARSSGKYELTMRTAFCGRVPLTLDTAKPSPDTNSPMSL